MAARAIDATEGTSDGATGGATGGASGNATGGISPDVRLGFVCAIFAYTIWGGFPLYLKLLDPASSLEVVSQRILWAVPFGALILTLRRQWRETLTAVRTRTTLLWLAASAGVISLNWFLYVWAVANARVLEASLGYYINPLMFVAVGVLVLGERLNRAQWIGIGFATMGVVVLTVGAGVFPWVSFVLAMSFGAYGYIRKQTAVGATPGLFIETIILAPVAAGLVWWLAAKGELAFGAHGTRLDILLMMAGPMTVVPLTLFALGARRLQLTTIGLLQYIGPTGQFLLGLYYGERFTLAHGICFGLIWTGLAITSVDAIRRQRKGARTAAAGAIPASGAPVALNPRATVSPSRKNS
ncbi:MAG: EamA family transporter RarD [Alphaproteobacteria bacterium]|nr:EamA family transporter RarD [Alphaproteobacteria bacterium]